MTKLTDESVKALLDGATENAYDLEVVKWGGGIRCVYLNDYRVAGEKPWGGGDTTRRFKVRMADIMRAFRGTVQAAAPDLARALLDARAELAAAQQREAGLVERAEKAEAERDKWFEGAGAHHVASMQQAQRADSAEAELAAIRKGETL